MRRAVTLLLACLVGVHCASPVDDAADGGEPRSGEQAPGEHRRDGAGGEGAPMMPHRGTQGRGFPIAAVAALGGTIDGILGSRGAHVASIIQTDDGVFYAAGTYKGSVMIGESVLHSRGDEDVFLLRAEPDGQLTWVRSVGSEGRESVPRVSVDPADAARVRLLGVTTGEMNCGDGPMTTWSATDTFFLCVFEGGSGASLVGGAFPVAP